MRKTKSPTDIKQSFRKKLNFLAIIMAESHEVDISNTTFQDACIQGKLETVRDLIGRGANIHADGELALIVACFNGRAGVVAELLDRGADINARNDRAIYIAIWREHPEVIELLLSRGAKTTQLHCHGYAPEIRAFIAYQDIRRRYWRKWREFLIIQWAKKMILVWYRPDMPGGQRVKKDIAKI